MRYLTLLAAIATIGFGGSALAVPFDTSTVSGVATVGSGGDYGSLYDAAAAFNGLAPNSLQGDWKLEILSDLIEPQNVGFANELVNSSLTIKPASGTSVTLEFAQTTDNAGPSGNLQLGVKSGSGGAPGLAWTDLVRTTNITIDGSNNGTDSRNLSILTSAGAAFAASAPVAFTGEVENVSIKNSHVYNLAGTGNFNYYGIGVAARFDTVNGNKLPVSVKVINNDIIVKNGIGHGIIFRTSGTAPGTYQGIGSFEIAGNSIKARVRGVFMDLGFNGLIENNDIEIGTVLNNSGFLNTAVAVNNGRAAVSQTLNVTNNRIYMRTNNTFTTGDYGVAGINVTSGGTNRTVNIINNMINIHPVVTSAVTGPITLVGIRVYSGLTYNIWHNSIRLVPNANLTGLAPIGTVSNTITASGIKLPQAATYTADLKNNIVRVGLSGAATLVTAMSAGTSNLTSDNNVFFNDAGSVFAATDSIASATIYNTLGDWQAGVAQDANSVVVDPQATAGSSWTTAENTSDLHFTPSNVAPTGVPTFAQVGSVTTDIDGETRLVSTLPGADEVNPSSVSDWAIY